MNKFKPTTCQQFLIYQWIKERFYLDFIELHNVNTYSITLTDINGEKLFIQHINGEIRYITLSDEIKKSHYAFSSNMTS